LPADVGFTLSADVARSSRSPDCTHTIEEAPVMRAKFSTWKHLLYSAAALATLILAAGARYKPK
jgi:hypothetical protein